LRQDVAEDLMQELFLKLSNSKDFDKAEHQVAFARRAGINIAFDWWRKRRREHQLLNDVRKPDANYNLPLDKLIQAEELETILNASSRLKEAAREVFVMHYIQQNSYKEIAKALGKKPNYVRALCSKALIKIRNLLRSNEPSDSGNEVSDG
jgi:RNA polymerase sigma factor (sigma-70 family)